MTNPNTARCSRRELLRRAAISALTPVAWQAARACAAAGLATVDLGEGIAAAIESGLLAGAAIIDGRAYSAASIPRFSLVPRLLQGLWRQQR